jgi:colicin import membrane protein
MAMDSTLTRQDNLMPQRTGGMGRGTAMALLVHVGLLIALAFGVSWRSQTPAGVSAELWAVTPQVAAPPAVEPKPAPAPKPPPPPAPAPKVEEPPKPTVNEAQIAIEKERKQRELVEQQERERQELVRKEQERQELARKEQERLEREKAEKLAAQKQRELEIKRQKDEEIREAKLREENLKRMLGQAAGTGAPNSPGTAAREAGPSASYAGRIVARVKPNIVLTDEVPGKHRQKQRQQGVGRGGAASARPHRGVAARHRRPRATEHGDRVPAARIARHVDSPSGRGVGPRSVACTGWAASGDAAGSA